MIYTITTNPSLDYYLKIDDLKMGVLNRSDAEEYDAGGKGVNVSKILNKLGITSTALGFLGGYNRDFYLSILEAYDGIQPQFTPIEGNTRINVKIEGEEETSLNAKGPHITKEEFERFARRFNSIYDNDYIVLSGNIQQELKSDLIDMMSDLMKSGIKVILDTDNDIVESLLPYKPYLVKMTYSNIGTDIVDILSTGRECIDKGVNFFMYSAKHMPSFLLMSDYYYKCDISDKTSLSISGTNDSMIAGFLWAKLRAASPLEAFTYANAVTISTALMDRDAHMDLIDKNYKELKVERFDY